MLKERLTPPPVVQSFASRGRSKPGSLLIHAGGGGGEGVRGESMLLMGWGKDNRTKNRSIGDSLGQPFFLRSHASPGTSTSIYGYR